MIISIGIHRKHGKVLSHEARRQIWGKSKQSIFISAILKHIFKTGPWKVYADVQIEHSFAPFINGEKKKSLCVTPARTQTAFAFKITEPVMWILYSPFAFSLSCLPPLSFGYWDSNSSRGHEGCSWTRVQWNIQFPSYICDKLCIYLCWIIHIVYSVSLTRLCFFPPAPTPQILLHSACSSQQLCRCALVAFFLRNSCSSFGFCSSFLSRVKSWTEWKRIVVRPIHWG